MRTPLFASVGLAALLALGIASPAHADTVTTHEVPVDTVLPAPTEVFNGNSQLWFSVGDWTVAPPWGATGALTLPHSTSLSVDSHGVALAIPAPRAGCVRVVNSYHYTFSWEIGQVLSSGAPVTTGLAGVPITSGLESSPGRTSWTITLNEPTPATDIAFIYQVFSVYNSPADLTVSDYSLNVTDTCPDVVVPEDTEVTGDGGGVAALPEAGIDVLPLGLGALALLGAGAAVLATRRFTRLAPRGE